MATSREAQASGRRDRPPVRDAQVTDIMRTWLNRFISTSDAHKKSAKRSVPVCRKPRLILETLEAREVPAIAIQFDFSYDGAGFFNDPVKRAVLQRAADDISANLNTQLAAILPSGSNSFNLSFFNPTNGQQVSVTNRAIPANTLLVYAGGRNLVGNEAGFGGYGGYSAGGSQQWLDSLRARGVGGVTLWGGSLTFDADANWYSNLSASGLIPGQIDLYSVASHELGHLLGIGTSPVWFSQISGGAFRGGNSSALYGGPVPVYGDGAHWADGVTIAGQHVSLDPILQSGTRVSLSSLDYAALMDLGWSVSIPGAPTPPVTSPPTSPVPVPPPVAPVPVGSNSSGSIFESPSSHGNGCCCAACNPIVLSGLADGSIQAFGLDDNGQLRAGGQRFVPFPGFTGVVRSVVGDFNGDGVQDFAFGTGAGIGAQVRIINGKDGTDLVRSTTVLDGFGGGVFLASGDINHDGLSDLVVSADAGGGNRLSVFTVTGGGLRRVNDFLAFNDPNFRGGSRVAVGDVNHDGYADIIVGAGIGGSPRVAIYSGASVFAGVSRTLIPDFFALDQNLRSGVFVSTADLDGDGFSDVIYSVGNAGGPRVRVVSGATLTANPGRNAYGLPAMADFFALDPNDRNGIRIAARDLSGDGKAELIISGGGNANPIVRVFSWPRLGDANVPYIKPFSDATIDGLYIG